MNHSLKWTDVREIAEALYEAHPDKNPLLINFVDLMGLIIALPAFADDPKHCNERVLEAVQGLWIEEAEE